MNAGMDIKLNDEVAGRTGGAFWDSWVVDGLVNFVGWFVRTGSWMLRRFQSGFVQAYAATMVFGLFVLLCVYLFLS